MPNVPVIVCTGFHRSATSLAAQLLSRGGLPMGTRLISSHISNPDGHFEDAELVALNDRFLKRSGSSWLFHDEVDLPSIEAVQDEISDYINQRDSVSPQGWGIKDPRLCLFLPCWARLLGERARYLVVIRHWSGSIQSLLNRHSRELAFNPRATGAKQTHLSFWCDPGLAPRMWLAHCRRLADFIEAYPGQVMVVPQPLLMSEFPLVEFINHKWELSLAPPPGTVVKPELSNPRVDESLRRLVIPSQECRMNQVWHHLLAAVPDEFLEVLGEAALAPEWVGESSKPLARVVLSTMRSIWEKEEVEAQRPIFPAPPWSRDGLLDWLKKVEFLENGNLEAATAWINEHAPDDQELWQSVAAHAIAIARFDLAEQALLRAIASGPGQANLWMRLGELHELAGRWARAEHYYREAIRRNPRNPAFVVALATLLQSTGRLTEAAEELSRAVSAAPLPKTVAALVTVLLESGRSSEAQQLIEGLIQSAPDQVQHWKRLQARVLMATDLNRAKALFHGDVRERLDQESLSALLAKMLEQVASKAEFEDLLERILSHWLELYSEEELEGKFQK